VKLYLAFHCHDIEHESNIADFDFGFLSDSSRDEQVEPKRKPLADRGGHLNPFVLFQLMGKCVLILLGVFAVACCQLAHFLAKL
jgi:hypothetical protein